jgi:prevent-host-death family protein
MTINKEGIKMATTIQVPIAEVKSRFSEYAARSAHAHEHVIITRRGKPLAALVGLDELAMIESLSSSRGLTQAMQRWNGVNAVREGVEEAYADRTREGDGRHVSL